MDKLEEGFREDTGGHLQPLRTIRTNSGEREKNRWCETPPTSQHRARLILPGEGKMGPARTWDLELARDCSVVYIYFKKTDDCFCYCPKPGSL